MELLNNHNLPIKYLFRTLNIVLFFFVIHRSDAQFITKGRIEYERKTNQYAFMDENNIWDEMAKKNLSKFVTYYFDLYFNENESLYKPGRENPAQQNKYWGVFDADNVVFHKTDSSIAVTQKTIFGDTYLISDSIRKTNWKIGTEMRNIAGFNCRKAVGKVLDSIIVVAFYTDEIIASGGPESFSGLPGMILGVAIPKMHTTWYATKVELKEPKALDLTVPKKGKKMPADDFNKKLSDILKSWGDDMRRVRWQLLL